MFRQRADWPQVGVKLQRLRRADVDRSKSFADRCRDGTFQPDFVALDDQSVLRAAWCRICPAPVGRRHAFPFDLDAEASMMRTTAEATFRADAVARNQCDTMHKSVGSKPVSSSRHSSSGSRSGQWPDREGGPHAALLSPPSRSGYCPVFRPTRFSIRLQLKLTMRK